MTEIPLLSLKDELLRVQRALRLQQAALAKRIAEGRSDGRAKRRLLRKERLHERMRKERQEHTQRRQMVKVRASSWPHRLAAAACACSLEVVC